MNIVLLGYRGSGKSTLGKMLADQLWKTFVDLDAEVCGRFKTDCIAEIWDRYGKSEFRRVESEVAVEVLAGDDQVIALGGGTVIIPEGRRVIEEAQNTVRIYLKCEPQVLLDHIRADQQSQANRPNLTPLGGGLQEIQSVLAEREPVYEAVADKTFDVTHLQLPDAARYLIKLCL